MSEYKFFKEVNSRELRNLKVLIGIFFAIIAIRYGYEYLTVEYAPVVSAMYAAIGGLKFLIICTTIDMVWKFTNQEKRDLVIRTVGVKKYRQMLIKLVYSVLAFNIILNTFECLVNRPEYYDSNVVIYAGNPVLGELWGIIFISLLFGTLFNCFFFIVLIFKEQVTKTNYRYVLPKEKIKHIISIIIEMAIIFALIVSYTTIKFNLAIPTAYVYTEVSEINSMVTPILLWILINWFVTSYYISLSKEKAGI